MRTSNLKIRLSLLHCVRQGDHSSSFSNDFGSQITSSPVLIPIAFTRKGYTPMSQPNWFDTYNNPNSGQQQAALVDKRDSFTDLSATWAGYSE